MPGDAGGSGGDALSGGQDDCAGLGARVACRPSSPGRAAAPAGVMPWRAQMMKATESASALRSPAQPEVVVPGGWPGHVVQQHVAELVRERPGSLLFAELRQEPDAAGGPEDGAVGRGAVLAFDRESLAAGQPAQRVPQTRAGGSRGGPAGAS